MKWNWQLPDWTDFKYNADMLKKAEEQFLYSSGIFFGVCKYLGDTDNRLLKIELASNEALETSEIEGEYLDRASVQSSIRKHFGLKADKKNIKPSEQGIADLIVDLYSNYQNQLDHKSLYRWHKMLMLGRKDLINIGTYRTGKDPMQIISGAVHKPIVHFEAPPANRIYKEMSQFIKWFNASEKSLPIIARSGIAHLYFESIHPFEDGNGRLGRYIAEKALAQGLKKPILIALATVINKDKKNYYAALAKASKTNEITAWLEYFADTILQALNYSHKNTEFLIKKTKLFERLKGTINSRQEKCLLRIFKEGLDGFKGGLSAENYIKITKATRATATRDLADLVKKGVFAKKGSLRHTRYYVSELLLL
ncbi:MAG: Fic family protein [Rickettsiales bacterium]|nr:Fic family protein [Rickettsiales bacterium]